ncbi:hypothetical protein [Albimonas pacifica]|uniref:Uncharacterized protein n=1 Tax=Albimonas pacifica TaxID=1114924 RepID=A0A1I3IKP8_9RHOB|nr:hypothetical protein [Albimonas pacifica]SFI48397.1 hypothetical protein SAMN05216258_107105 [Albimonas pacifica]
MSARRRGTARLRLRRRGAAAALALLAAAAAASLGLGGGAAPGARFTVSGRVINPDLPAVSVTLEPSGNGLRLGGDGFEPLVYRTMFTAGAAAPDRILADPAELSAGGLRSGALDGAEARIYRIRGGALELVRRDRVPPGGHVLESWRRLTGDDAALPAATLGLPLAWEPEHRPGAPTWFRVRAVAGDGTLSAPSAEVMAPAPEGPAREAAAKRGAFKALVALALPVERGLREGPQPGPAALRLEPGEPGAPRLAWDPVPGARGYVIERTDAPPGSRRGSYLALEGGAGAPGVEAGDLVILSRSFPDPSREALIADRAWDGRAARRLRPGPLSRWAEEPGGAPWRLRPHAPDAPVEEAGRSYLELELQAGRPVQLSGARFADDAQHWYEVLRPEPYRVEAWVRSDAPGRARLEVLGGGAWGARQPAASFETGPEWRRIAAEFVGDEAARRARGRFALTLEGAGRFGVDNFRIRRAGTPWLDLDARDYARLRAAQVSLLRTHPLIKTGRWTYDLAQLTDPPGLASGTAGGSSLPQMLRMAQGAGADPWLQIEPHLAPEEWDGLLEYLAAPAGSGPWADKRAAQGRAAPWTEAFGRIWFEIGNETWNRLFRPWTFPAMVDAQTGRRYAPGEVYGLFQQQTIDRLRASPRWRAADLDRRAVFALGGFNVLDYGEQAARTSPGSGFVGLGPYLGGWDADQPAPTGTPENFATLLNWTAQNTEPLGRMHIARAAQAARARGVPLEVGTYEAGPGYVMEGLGREDVEVQERVMKSQAAGVATLDGFLALSALGYRMQSFFAYGEGRWWRSHARWDRGGHAYPAWELLELLNREALGDMLAVETRAVPTLDLAAAKRREAVPDAPQVAAYATRRGDRLALVLISRRLPDLPAPAPGEAAPGCTPVEVALPFASAASLVVHRMDGPYDAHDVDADRVRIAREALAPPADPTRFRLGPATGAPACGLPPASAYLYVFEGIVD